MPPVVRTSSTKNKQSRLQSAMEYLMTYGWAILTIAVVLGALYYFGVFNGSGALGNSCLAAAGYLCTNPLLNSSGYVSLNIAVTGGAITIRGINCTSNTTQPTIYQTVDPRTLQSGNTASIYAKCIGAAGPIGKKYSGFIWINYSTATTSGLYAKIAAISTTVTSGGNQTANTFEPKCTGSGTNNTIVTSYISLNVTNIKTVAYTMYGGGGGGSANAMGSNGLFASGNVVVSYGQVFTVYAGGGGGGGGYYGGGGGGSGYYGGGGGGAGYEGPAGGGGSSAILLSGALVQYAAGGAGNGVPGNGGPGGGGSNTGGSAGAAGDHGAGAAGGNLYGGNGADCVYGGVAGTGGNGGGAVSCSGGGGGAGYGGGGGAGSGGNGGGNGGSNGGSSGGTGGDSGTGGGINGVISGNGGNGGSVMLSWAGSNCPI